MRHDNKYYLILLEKKFFLRGKKKKKRKIVVDRMFPITGSQGTPKLGGGDRVGE